MNKLYCYIIILLITYLIYDTTYISYDPAIIHPAIL